MPANTIVGDYSVFSASKRWNKPDDRQPTTSQQMFECLACFLAHRNRQQCNGSDHRAHHFFGYCTAFVVRQASDFLALPNVRRQVDASEGNLGTNEIWCEYLISSLDLVCHEKCPPGLLHVTTQQPKWSSQCNSSRAFLAFRKPITFGSTFLISLFIRFKYAAFSLQLHHQLDVHIHIHIAAKILNEN